MTATDRLRAMLDERGVEWESDDFPGIDGKVVYRYTYWGDGGGFCFCEPVGATPGTLGAKCDFSAIGFTPEQAIAATLGAGTCRMETDESCQNWNSCSVCDSDYYTDQPINYCPNCGRKVEG